MSNTEQMVSVPLVPTDEMIVAFAEAWYSKRQVIDDPDMLDAYKAMLDAAPAARHQGEPVAPWFYFADCADPDYSHLFNHESEAQTQVSDHGGKVVKLWNVLPPSDAGEVERLQAEVKSLQFITHRAAIDLLSAQSQLAERDELLREARDDLAEWANTYGNSDSTDTDLIIEKIDALSASAEPSAPVERDERDDPQPVPVAWMRFDDEQRAIFTRSKRTKDSEPLYVHPTAYRQARAALERKP